MATQASEKGVSQARGNRRTEIGVVASDKCDKTVIVVVNRLVKHPQYKKYLLRRTKFYAHDEKNEARQGDRVEIRETRPLSKLKRWTLVRVVERAEQIGDVGFETPSVLQPKKLRPVKEGPGAGTAGEPSPVNAEQTPPAEAPATPAAPPSEAPKPEDEKK